MARATASGLALGARAGAQPRGTAWCPGTPPPTTRGPAQSIGWGGMRAARSTSLCSRMDLYRTSTVVHTTEPVKPEVSTAARPGPARAVDDPPVFGGVRPGGTTPISTPGLANGTPDPSLPRAGRAALRPRPGLR